MIVIGVDPGITGAIAAVCNKRGLLAVSDLPICSNGLTTGRLLRWLDVEKLDGILREWSALFDFAGEDVRAVLERPIAMPGQQIATAASSFDMQGAIRAVLTMRGYPLEFVTPNEWKRYYRLGKAKSEARATAFALYPQAPVTRAKDDGRAEAILIARYVMRRDE